MMSFSDLLRKKLRDDNLSEVARSIGVSRSVLNQWVNGKRSPNLSNIEPLQALAEYLNITLEELLVGKSVNKEIGSCSFRDENRQYRIKIERSE